MVECGSVPARPVIGLTLCVGGRGVRKACDELLDYAIGFVTPADIDAFAPGDPGYPDYVREWRRILASRSIPSEANFDITETVGLTRWADADREADPTRFRRFRVFTNAVALGMAASDHADDDNFPPNYTLISLIDDANALQDSSLWQLLSPAFEEAYQAWRRQRSDESVFALLGLLLVNVQQRASEVSLVELAERLIEEESRCQHRVHAVFVFGCTCYDQLNDRWKRYIRHWIQPTSQSLALLRDALLDGEPADA
jgi:hypothetical protein